MSFRVGTYRFRIALLRRVAARSGKLSRWLRYPNPLQAPWRSSAIDVARSGALGDVLMCTPGLREFKRLRPTCRIRFYTNFPSLVDGLPYIDEVLPMNAAPEKRINLGYELAASPRDHLARIIGDSLGIAVRDVRPDCVIDWSLVNRYRTLWVHRPRPHIVITRNASKWTPNKDWPQAHWNELVNRLTRRATIIELGLDTSLESGFCPDHYVDLRGATSIQEMVAAVAAADLYVGPVSAPVHIAAAAGKRSVVIIGGYEHPSNTWYSSNISFYTPVECAPCWLREPCPHSRKCLKAIVPGEVEKAIWRLWQQSGFNASSLKK